MSLANPRRGEVSLRIEGKDCRLRLTLGALAALEAQLATDSLPQLIERLASDAVTAEDIIAVLDAGLYGGGYRDMRAADCVIDGGAISAATAARSLILLGIGHEL